MNPAIIIRIGFFAREPFWKSVPLRNPPKTFLPKVLGRGCGGGPFLQKGFPPHLLQNSGLYSQEVLQEFFAFVGEDRFRVELDALHGVFIVADAHYYAFFRL